MLPELPTVAALDGQTAGVDATVVDGSRPEAEDLAPDGGGEVEVVVEGGGVRAQRAEGDRAGWDVGRIAHGDIVEARRVLQVQDSLDGLDVPVVAHV